MNPVGATAIACDTWRSYGMGKGLPTPIGRSKTFDAPNRGNRSV